MRKIIKALVLLGVAALSVLGFAACLGGISIFECGGGGYTPKPQELTFYERWDGYEVTGGKAASDGTISIPSTYKGQPVVSIGDQAFEQNYSLSKIIISDSVERIGDRAFSDCRDIKSITFGSGLKSIGEYAFYEATRNNKVYMELVLPEGLSTVGKQAFVSNKISKITFPSTLISIGESAFGGLALKTIEFPQNSKLQTISDSAFSGCDATRIVLPDSLKTIGKNAFDMCRSVTGIRVGNGVETIGDYAFSRCSALTEIDIPQGVLTIGKDIFSSCTALKTVMINNQTVANGIFSGCSALETLKISENLTSVNAALLDGCKSTPTIEYSGTAKQWAQISGVQAFTKNGDITVKFGKDKLTDIDLTGVPAVQPYAFYKLKGADRLTVTSDLVSVGEKAFEGLQVKSVTAPADKLGVLDLNKTEKLTVIDGGTLKKSDISSAGALKTFIAEDLLSVEAGAFDGVPIETATVQAKLLSEIKGQTVKKITVCGGDEIGQSALSGSENLSEIVIADTVTKISPNAFSGCESLDGIILPEGLNTLGQGAFDGCKALTKITLPKNVAEIGWGLFRNCAKLKSVEIKGKVTAVGFYAFADCVSLESIELQHVLTVGDDAFSGCINLASVTFGGGLDEIGEGAFFDCAALTEINFGGSKTAWSFVDKAEGWKDGVPTTCVVRCSNGTIPV